MVWEILCRPGKKAKIGTKFHFEHNDAVLEAEIIDVLDDGNRIAKFTCDKNFYETLDEIGQMPLPPYITEKLKDKAWAMLYYNEGDLTHRGPKISPQDKRTKLSVRCIRDVK